MAIREHLLEFQKADADKMIQKKSMINANRMGAGKTVTTLDAIEELKATPCLIVAPKFAHSVWQEELWTWMQEKAIIYNGTPKKRIQQWDEFVSSGCKFLITNYEMLEEVARKSGITLKPAALPTPGTFWKWESIIWDEAHNGGLLNRKNKAFKISAKLAKIIPVRYPLTATPIRKGCVDLFALLHLVDPRGFDSYWKYVNRHCVVTSTPFGKEIEKNPANLAHFRKMLSEYMIRRPASEVAAERPGAIRQPLLVEMNKEQKKIYDELTEELMALIPETGEILMTPQQMTLMLRQRQILAAPQVLGLKHRGAAIDTVVEHSRNIIQDGNAIVIFTSFRQAVPKIEEALRDEHGEDLPIYKITGGMTSQEFGDSWQSFQKGTGAAVLICVIKSSASFHATRASTAYFIGHEWDFNLNEQAEGRLDRYGQKELVNVFYLLYKGTVDDHLSRRLNEKKSAANLIVGTEEEYLKELKSRSK